MTNPKSQHLDIPDFIIGRQNILVIYTLYIPSIRCTYNVLFILLILIYYQYFVYSIKK